MTITGIVQDIVSDQYATFVIIERDDNRKMLAVRCWSKSQREEAKALRPGDRLEVTGDVSSRASKNDSKRWFTNYEATSVKVLPGAVENDGKDAAPADTDLF